MRPHHWGAGLLTITLAGPAAADSLGTARGQGLRERRHEAWLRVDDGVARYRVERTIDNPGERADEARFDIGLPVGAAAVGLRIKVGDDWLEGELMGADRAAELYRELTGFGPHVPKDPALLSWRWVSDLALQVFPVPAGGRSHVGYSLVAPTRYRDGRYFVTYPRIPAGDGLAASAVQVAGAHPRLDGRPVAPGTLIPLTQAKAEGPPAWLEGHPVRGDASYVKSDLHVEEAGTTREVRVTVDVQHTYRSDLTLELVAPDGSWHRLFDGEGGDGNDVRDTFSVHFDAPVEAHGTWRLVANDHAGLDTGTIQGWSLASTVAGRAVEATAGDTPVFIPDAPSAGDDGQATISVDAPPIATIAGRLGRVPITEDRAAFRLEIDTAFPLRPTPEGLSAVFVVDASRSLRDGIAPQLTTIRSFLSHVPDASFEIVAVRREAKRVLGRFAGAKDVDAALAAAERAGAFELGNGSHLDAGVAEAAQALRGREGPRTVVLLSDALLRPSWHERLARPGIDATGATVHVVLPKAGSRAPRDRRDDDHALAPLARRSGGVLLHIDGIDGRSKPLDAISLGLVRPIRIDDVEVDGVTLPEGRRFPARLDEGRGVREMALLPQAPARVTVRGQIWSRPFVREVRATQPFSRATAAFVFSHDLHRGLPEDAQFRLAMTAGAVSPVTSYLAVEPGVRPSTDGLVRGGQGFGSGHGRLGGSHRVRRGSVQITPPPFDLRDVIRDDVTACAAAHRASDGWHVDLTLHLTYEEIVDIEAARGGLAQCIAEAAWGVAMPPAHFHEERDRLVVRFGPGA